MFDIVINRETCTRCGACVALCTGHVFETVGERIEVALVLGYPQYRFRRVLPRRRPNLIWSTQ